MKKYKDIEIGDTFDKLTVVAKGKRENYKQFWICKCNCGNIKLKEINGANLKNGHIHSCGFCKSFYDWCIQNNRQDLLERWDYELNTDLPNEISFTSNKDFYFKCPQHIHSSELKKIAYLTKNNCGLCNQCNSIAQYLINTYGDKALELYWDYNKNKLNPWNISKGSNTKIFIKCQEKSYHESYSVLCYSFINGCRCHFCSGSKTHPKDSIAQYCIDNIDKDFLEKYWDYENNNKLNRNPWRISIHSHCKIWIKCQEKDYHGSYEISCDAFYNGGRCPYCVGKQVCILDSLGTLFPQVIPLWSDKNKKSPFEYAPMSNQKVLWKCPDGKHEDYLRSINSSQAKHFNCPSCVRERHESFLEEKVRLYIKEKYPTLILNHENKCTLVPINPKTKYQLPFDNEIQNLKLIIEVQGAQHYNTNFYYFKNKLQTITPEEHLHYQQLKDRYKKFIAFHNGYFYLVIPYWTNDNEKYKQLIDNKIREISEKDKGGIVKWMTN